MASGLADHLAAADRASSPLVGVKSGKLVARRPSTGAVLDDPRRAVAPVAILEEPLVELAGVLSGEGGVEVDRPGALERGQPLAAEREELGLHLGTGSLRVHQLHHRLDLLAQ